MKSRDYTDFYVGFFTKQHQVEKQAASPLAVGDTVRVIGPEYTGQVGEVRVIDEEDGNELPYGVYLDSAERVVPFGVGEIERVENIDKVVHIPQNCDKCGQKRKTLTNTGTEAYPVWKCGTCLHREARRQNTREMYGKGRRGY